MKASLKNKIELLAPAGNIEKMQFAFAYGADAVYAGIPEFSLRIRINDFDLRKLREAAEYAHGLGKKIYVTANIFAHNQHLDKLPAYIKELKKIGVDALIVSDPGILAVIKKVWPACEIHLSTQANCTNWQAAKFWHDQGVKRVILGREVTLNEIKEIHRKVPRLELEYFIHGAMCMAYSGRCFLSKYMRDRSANLGDCVQPCRWEYTPLIKGGWGDLKCADKELNEMIISNGPHDFELVQEPHGSYILNSKDLCLIKHLDKLIEAGVTSFKIEGRAKSVYYQGVVVGAYHAALYPIDKGGQGGLGLDERKKGEKGNNGRKARLNKLYKELETKLVHRGYTTGFLLGEKADQNLSESHQTSDWEFCGQVLDGKKKIGEKRKGYILVKVHNSFRSGDKIEILTPDYGIIKMSVKEIFDDKTGERLDSAHGGQEKKVLLRVSTKRAISEYSLLRKKK